jgi:hypothetical protein
MSAPRVNLVQVLNGDSAPGGPESPFQETIREKNMKAWMYITVVSLFVALATPTRMAAQDSTSQNHKHHHYKLIDLGTFGGPTSWVSNPDAKDLNNRGTVQGWADTSVPDPNYPNCWDVID